MDAARGSTGRGKRGIDLVVKLTKLCLAAEKSRIVPAKHAVGDDKVGRNAAIGVGGE